MSTLLPTGTTPFIGREPERAAVQAALAAHRLVTLAGPGGVGKTRLAVEIARRWPQPVVFCHLEAARQAADVTAALARALDLPLTRSEAADPARALEAELSARAPVVVLDTVEHLRPVLDGLLARWQQAAPSARWLLTARWPLRLPGEVVVPVGALAAGTDLFRAAAPVSLAQDPETQEEIEELVRQLDGLPLALELAAARLEVLPLAELRRRLRERFTLLRDPERPDERHGALWNTVAWSWALLAPWEQVALRHLAVFEAAFSLDAAEAVCQPPDGLGALDALHTLVRKALVAQVAPNRYALPQTIRAFARAQYAGPAEQAAVEARHTAWCLAVDPAAVEVLGACLPELRAVMGRALATQPATAASADVALRAALRLQGLLMSHLPAADAEPLLESALAHAAPWPHPLSGEIHRLRARALRYLGRLEEALACLDVAEAACPDPEGPDRARIANTRAEVLSLSHRLPAARAAAELALALHRRHESRHGQGISEAQIGLICSFQGDLREAHARWTSARELLEGSGDRFYQAVVLGHLASLALERGDLAAARRDADQAIALHRALGNRRSEAICQGYRALCHHHAGEPAAARPAYHQVITALEAEGEARMAACYRLYDALLDLELGGAPADALAAVDAELARLGERRYLALARCARAAVAIRQGAEPDPELAQVKAELKAVADPLLTPIYGLPRAAALLAVGAERSEILFQSEMMDRVAGDDARLAARVVRAWVQAADADARAWRFDADGRWFRSPEGEAVDLAHRVPLTRLLAALLQARGEEVTRDALIAAGWPGERLVPEAAGNRLRVGLSTLRSLGLGDLIQRTESGYRLDPAIPVRVDA